MKWLLRMVGLLGPDPKKMPDGWGLVRVSPRTLGTEKGFRKDFMKTFPYATKEEVKAVIAHLKEFKSDSNPSVSLFVDKELYNNLPFTEHMWLISSGNIGCGCGQGKRGCCGMPVLVAPDGTMHAKSYFILEYLDLKDWEFERSDDIDDDEEVY